MDRLFFTWRGTCLLSKSSRLKHHGRNIANMNINTVLTLFFLPNFLQYFRRSTLSAVLNFIEPFVVSADFTLIPHNSFQGFTTQQNTRKRVHFIPDILHIVFISIKTLEHHPVFLKTEIKSAHFNKNKPTSIGIMTLVHNYVHIIRCDVITYPFL